MQLFYVVLNVIINYNLLFYRNYNCKFLFIMICFYLIKKFMYKSILKKEIAGREAILGLLNIFVNAALSDNFKADGDNTLECRLYHLVSASYRVVNEKYEHYENKLYCKLRLVVDFIAGMTDSYAVDLYQELKGIKL